MEKTHVSLLGNKIGRRTFIKGSAAALGLAALSGAAFAPAGKLKAAEADAAANDDQEFFGVCRGNCFGGCALSIRVRDGKVVSTDAAELPDEQYMRICQRGHAHLQRIYDPDRLKTPIRRVGERGSGEWEAITWEEAAEEIAGKWKQYIDESGPESIAFCSGSGNFGVMSNNAAARLRDKLGACTVQFCYDNCYFHAGIHAEGVGDGFNANEIADIVNAKVIVLWGSNPAVAQPQNWHFIMDAKEAGAKLVVIDPNYTVSATQADMFVPIRPATDTALLMAMINIVVENGWIDPDTIKRLTVGPYLVKEADGLFLRQSDLGVKLEEGAADMPVVLDADGNWGTLVDIADPVFEGSFEVEGNAVTCAYTLLIESCKEWTVERAAELCDLPVDLIQELARIYAEGPSTIYQGFGPDHYVNGERAYFTQIALAAITGNIAKPGATCGYDWTYAGLLKYVRPAAMTPAGAVSGHTVVSPQLLDIKRSGEVEGYPIDVRSMYIWNSNLLGNQTDRTSWIELFNELDLVVVADMRLGDTANYADIVLPVVHWFEAEEIMPQTSPYLLFQDKVTEPLYESKTDLEIINMLGQAMGYPEDFSLTVEDYLRGVLNNDGAKAANITYDRLKEEKYIDIMSGDPYYIHGGSGTFRTATGKINFYYEKPAPYINYGQSFDVEAARLPYWMPPHEAWPQTVAEFEANPLGEKYPLVYTTERNRMKCHTQWGHAPWLLELYGEPVLRINPIDAESRGIADGDYVRAFNDRGEAVFKASIHPGARPGVVIAPKGWEEDQFKQGHYSNLTSRYFNPFTPNNCFFDALVQIEKA
ncbi:MAG: molybdopterin-dependent oxidoreductase [Coriobacteriales bacterium]|nr:molybdopterin-dependent oxidoreductase [Coriobacteriales bacterium]